MGKSFDAIVSALKSYIQSTNPKLDTSEGTVLNDIVISAPAQQIANFYNDLDVISLDQAIDTANDTALDLIGSNFGLIRKDARRAVGTITFFVATAPTSNISIPVGTVVATSPTSTSPAVQFNTLQDVTLDIGLIGTYLNPATGKYEISAAIEASTAGVTGNVGSNAITSLVNPLGGINGVYNSLSTSGGTDTESNDNFLSRIALALLGNSVGTDDGFLKVVLAQPAVVDVALVGHGDTGRMDFGAIDMYVKGKTIKFQNDTFLGTSDMVLTKQPVLLGGVSLVQSSASGSLSNWALVKDTSVYAGSIQAQDKIHWTVPIDSTYGTIFVSYSYNGIVEDLQGLFTKTNLDVLDTSLLIKWADELPINLTASIKITSGFDIDDTRSQVSAAVTSLLSTAGIGQALKTSDLVTTIRNTSGVDDVVVPFTVFQSQDGSIVPDASNNLIIPFNAYATPGVLTFPIVTTL